MNLRPLHHALLVALLGAAASVAAAQSPTGGTKADTGAATGASAGAASVNSDMSATASHAMPSAHANRTKTAAGTRTHRTHASGTTGSGSGDARYDAALRQCVEGPAASRENCIDRAIDEHGR